MLNTYTHFAKLRIAIEAESDAEAFALTREVLDELAKVLPTGVSFVRDKYDEVKIKSN